MTTEPACTYKPAATGDQVSLARKGRLRRLRKLIVLQRTAAWRSAARKGVAAAVEHRHVPFGPHFGTIIDVGAHHGQFSLLARALYPDADIICIEPLPEALDRLRRVHAHDKHVMIVPFAAASASGRHCLHVSRKSDSSSLLPILESYVKAFPDTEESTTIEVDVQTLDALISPDIRPPTLLKIDAQGGELQVLAGAHEVLAKVEAAYVECSFVEFYHGQALADEVIRLVVSSGLRLSGVYSVVRDDQGRCLQADMLFRRGC